MGKFGPQIDQSDCRFLESHIIICFRFRYNFNFTKTLYISYNVMQAFVYDLHSFLISHLTIVAAIFEATEAVLCAWLIT